MRKTVLDLGSTSIIFRKDGIALEFSLE